ncbi:uncharacterized protein LOC128733535 [Sabethes cyaneus]|uniref:uncharacterized protein LOC128733535 n=1 Tax=Sabethes cyaneus TaxID=53552 RepID=UPI00237E0F18|nr:uncharacterized protein LOC128733535 [Sabethes cyaneus]
MSSNDQQPSSSANSSAFIDMTDDDSSLISPTAIGVGKPSADSLMSDDEGKVLTTLEPLKSTPVAAKDKVIIHSHTIIKPTSDSKGRSSSELAAIQKDELLAKMKSRLSKQIDLKVVPTTPKKQPAESTHHDSSGSIEIPHDLILSSDIPATPLSSAAAKGELEDHDLIAILEGDDVEITENATEIEVTVGRDVGYNDGQVLEEIQISFVDDQELEKEREKEIATRQMANLPILPKGRRPKVPTSLALNKPDSTTPVTTKGQITNKTQTTIKGQTTIKPLPRPLLVPKKEPEDNFIIPDLKTSPSSKSVKTSAVLPKSPSKITTPTHTNSSPRDSKQSPNELINALVSDWDDEPVSTKEEPVVLIKSSPKQNTSLPMLPPPAPVEPPKRSRIIKKKIIWDPDNPETHMSFASFVKSNRTKEAETPKAKTEEFSKPSPPIVRPPGTGIRRKRAESVAVHMMNDPPYTPPPYLKRARTPEPTTKRTNLNSNAAKATNVARKKKSEIEMLLGDEGAINMLYDVECENSNKDLLKDADIALDSDDEDEKLLAKAKIITDAVIKQGTSPTDSTPSVPRVRAKRASTPQQTSTSPAPPTAPAAIITSTAPISSQRKSGGTTSNGANSRKRKQTSASEDWDYVYSARKTCDDAMIIRRRSNSSYSSSTSPRRLSVEQTATPSSETVVTNQQNNSGFEFVKPSGKSSSKAAPNLKVDSSLVADMKGKLTKVLGGGKTLKDGSLNISIPSPSFSSSTQPGEKRAKMSPKAKVLSKTDGVTTVKISEKEITSATVSSGETLQYKLSELKLTELSCNTIGSYAEIILAPRETKLRDVFSVDLINELKTVLILLKNEPSVRAVLLRSSGKHFSRGIDVSYLIQPNAEKRKNVAQVYSGHLRNFLQTLVTFNKPLVAAVHGDVLGLGVTILPLFEVIIASENTTFCTPYAHFGHLPEAMKIFSTAKNLKPKAITDLLYLSRKISASTALDYGVITEIVSAEKLQDKANSVTKRLSSLSTQAFKSIKANLRQELVAHLDDQLVAEQKKLTQQWITTECQEKFKLFLSRGGEW